jgi:sarcosine oxidase delta subunit
MSALSCSHCGARAELIGRDELVISVGQRAITLPGGIDIIKCPLCGVREQQSSHTTVVVNSIEMAQPNERVDCR